jgi:hypothetical protein
MNIYPFSDISHGIIGQMTSLDNGSKLMFDISSKLSPLKGDEILKEGKIWRCIENKETDKPDVDRVKLYYVG